MRSEPRKARTRTFLPLLYHNDKWPDGCGRVVGGCEGEKKVRKIAAQKAKKKSRLPGGRATKIKGQGTPESRLRSKHSLKPYDSQAFTQDPTDTGTGYPSRWALMEIEAL